MGKTKREHEKEMYILLYESLKSDGVYNFFEFDDWTADCTALEFLRKRGMEDAVRGIGLLKVVENYGSTGLEILNCISRNRNKLSVRFLKDFDKN